MPLARNSLIERSFWLQESSCWIHWFALDSPAAVQHGTLTMDEISAEYVTMLRKLMRNGFKQKEDSYAFVYTNKQVYELCRTTLLYEYVAIQQRSYLAHIIRQDDNTIAKKLLFENEPLNTHGRSITLMKTMENENCTKAHLMYRAMNRTYYPDYFLDQWSWKRFDIINVNVKCFHYFFIPSKILAVFPQKAVTWAVFLCLLVVLFDMESIL